MIKLIIFDLDGVLTDTRELHFQALNAALGPYYEIGREEHLTTYDGNSTKTKLQMLTKNKGLPPESYDTIWQAKQQKTIEIVNQTFQVDERVVAILKTLKQEGFILYCASNSIYQTVKQMLAKSGFLEYMDYFISNEDVQHPKPSPEMYFRCMARANVAVQECLICEDSPIGRRAALDSGAFLCTIENPQDLTLEKIRASLSPISPPPLLKFHMQRLRVVIPMAGRGSRFLGTHSRPKPLIDVGGKPMIQVVIENLNLAAQFIYIVQQEHCDRYLLHYLLQALTPGCCIIPIDHITDGQACTVLLAEPFINDDDPVLFANSDQYLEWDSNKFVYEMLSPEVDGGISTFIDPEANPKWSFCRLGATSFVEETAEKRPISQIATTGVYFWKRGRDFVHFAKEMISERLKVNGEYYICPVYNNAIRAGKKFKISHCQRMWGLGVPDDLETFLKRSIKK